MSLIYYYTTNTTVLHLNTLHAYYRQTHLVSSTPATQLPNRPRDHATLPPALKPILLEHTTTSIPLPPMLAITSSPLNNLSPSPMASHTRPRERNAGRPTRPGQPQPPQPRDGDTHRTLLFDFSFNDNNHAAFSLRRGRGDPQPRDPGNGRGPKNPKPQPPWPRDPPNGRMALRANAFVCKRDPQPRDPGE